MSVYDEAALERMLGDLESDLVERKESFKGDASSKAREAACAFANDLPAHGQPGVLFVGARDNGDPSGVPVTDELLEVNSSYVGVTPETGAMKTIAFFNNKGGVGKTSLVYHLAWMYSDLGLRVLAADLDPQANLTTMFLGEEELEGLWPSGLPGRTILAPLLPLLEGEGGIADPHVEDIAGIGLLAGDLPSPGSRMS